MILYLDNQKSIGPNAAPGRLAGKGLNENLAREIMELHTLGVGSGLHPGRRHRVRPRNHRLERRRARKRDGLARRLRLQAELA